MLALICGQGNLPRAIAQAQPTPPLVCVLHGFAPEGLAADLIFRLENLGRVMRDLARRGVTEICLCGAIRRPPVDPARIDAETLPLVPRLQQALTQGDDGALRIVMRIFEDEGFAIRAAHELAPQLLEPAGTPTAMPHGPAHEAAARLGERTVAALGARDAGQACVIRAGRVLSREDAKGTDAMLHDLARQRISAGVATSLPAAGDLIGPLIQDIAALSAGDLAPAEGGILFKAPKPGQDRRADLPVIGPGTAEAAAAAGLDGIVIEAGGVMVLDRAETLARLDRHGLFLWSRARSG